MSDLIYQFSQQAHPGRLTAIGQGIGNIGSAIIARKKEEQRMAAYNSLLNQFNETQDPSLIPQLQNIAPEKFEGFQKAQSMMDEMGRKQTVQSNMETLGLLYSGNNEKAAEALEYKAKAAENSGDTEDAQVLRDMAASVKSGDTQNVINRIALLTGMFPEGKEALDTMWKMNSETRENVLSDAKVTEVMSSINVNDEQKKQLGDEMKELPGGFGNMLADLLIARGGADGMSAEELFKSEQALRKEYDAFVENFNTVVDGASEVQRLADLGTGFGDQGMIMNFNKVLDPNSVVRESEARMTADNQSLVNKGRTLLASLQAGERLSPEARNELLGAVKVMADLASNNITTQRERIGKTVEDYGFDRYRVLGEDPEKTQAPVQNTVGGAATRSVPSGDRLALKRAFVKQNNPQSSANFDLMSDEELNRYNAGRMYDEQNPVQEVEEEIQEVDY